MTIMPLKKTNTEGDSSELEEIIAEVAGKANETEQLPENYWRIDIYVDYEALDDKYKERLKESFSKIKVYSPKGLGEGKRKSIAYIAPQSLGERVSGQEPSSEFENKVRNYEGTNKQELHSYMTSIGRKPIRLIAVKKAALPGNTIAAVLSDGYEGILLANKNNGGFESNVRRFALNYGVPERVAERYIMDHENAHIYQKGLGFRGYAAEKDVERVLSDFYRQKALKYRGTSKETEYKQLERIAERRFNEAGMNYRKAV